MRRIICSLLLLACLLSLWGCAEESKAGTANFYYTRESFIYGQEDGVIAPEVRDITQFSDEKAIFTTYLKGPNDISLVSPFPRGVKIIELVYEDNTLYVTLSAHIVTLPKAKQVLACACFARTAMELTGVKAVSFQTADTELVRMEPILIDENSVLLYDDYQAPTPTEP